MTTLNISSFTWRFADDVLQDVYVRGRAFLRWEVLPYAPDAWHTPDSVRVGYEISFTRHFCKPRLLRSLEEIRADILALESESAGLLGEIVGGGKL